MTLPSISTEKGFCEPHPRGLDPAAHNPRKRPKPAAGLKREGSLPAQAVIETPAAGFGKGSGSLMTVHDADWFPGRRRRCAYLGFLMGLFRKYPNRFARLLTNT